MKVHERLVEADQAVGRAVLEAQPTVAIPDLALLAGIPASELRRVVRSARDAADQSAPPTTAPSDDPERPAPPAAQSADLDGAQPLDVGAALATTSAR